MLTCYIKGKNIIDGAEERYRIADGAVFVDNYNETLDSGTIILPQLDHKIEIEPYDVVKVYMGETPIKTLCVDGYVCTQTSLDPEIYRYEIKLFSETKLLEGILCPSLAITKLGSGTPRSVYHYLERYLELYGTKTNSDPIQGPYGERFSLGDSLDRFRDVECPELQWNEPTLREVFTDLMMVDDCIPVIIDGAIECIDVGEVGDEISADQRRRINYITESQSSEDYVSEVKMNLQNGTNGSSLEDGQPPRDCTRIVERIGFRNDDTYLLDTNRIVLQTSFPIWRVFRLKCYVYAEQMYQWHIDFQQSGYDKARVYVEVDLTEYLLEYNKWLTRDVYYSSWGNDTELSAEYRNTCLYYKRGSRNIENFNDKYENQFLWITNNQYVVDLIVRKGGSSQDYQDELEEQAKADCLAKGRSFARMEGTFAMPNFKSLLFALEYEPIDECVFLASKTPFQRNRRTIVDNQTNSYINTERQGFLEYMKANRLGNKAIVANGRYGTNETLPELSQKINGKIVFKRELAYYENHIGVNFYATEDYVMRDYYTGIKSKLRSWRVVSGNEALLRKEVRKFYVNGNIPSIANQTWTIPSYPSLDEYLRRFNYCIAIFVTSEVPYATKPSTQVDGTTYYFIEVEFSKHIVGNSVVFTIRMKDNFYAGNYISNLNGENGRVEQKGIGYTDANGEFAIMELYFYETKDFHDLPEPLPQQLQVYPNQPLTNVGYYSNLVARIPVKIYKDNKEIPQVSIQFELNEEANDMFLGKK